VCKLPSNYPLRLSLHCVPATHFWLSPVASKHCIGTCFGIGLKSNSLPFPGRARLGSFSIQPHRHRRSAEQSVNFRRHCLGFSAFVCGPIPSQNETGSSAAISTGPLSGRSQPRYYNWLSASHADRVEGIPVPFWRATTAVTCLRSHAQGCAGWGTPGV
jgi:hypothetical protein